MTALLWTAAYGGTRLGSTSAIPHQDRTGDGSTAASGQRSVRASRAVSGEPACQALLSRYAGLRRGIRQPPVMLLWNRSAAVPLSLGATYPALTIYSRHHRLTGAVACRISNDPKRGASLHSSFASDAAGLGRRTWDCSPASGGGPRVCGGRRSRSSLVSASPGIPGSSKAATYRYRPDFSTAYRMRCAWMMQSARRCSRWRVRLAPSISSA